MGRRCTGTIYPPYVTISTQWEDIWGGMVRISIKGSIERMRNARNSQKEKQSQLQSNDIQLPRFSNEGDW